MVVAENVTSHSGSGDTKSSSTAILPTSGTNGHAATIRPLVFSIMLSLGMVGITSSPWSVTEARADIIADQSAPANQRPIVTQAANSIPLVNIQTPSAAGVSRNTYSQFDVNNQGVILNNSRTNVQTQLGGYVQGNPYMAAGTARVILNEVNSSNPSLLHGYVEVAGSRAQVVIANPAGISCNGCGFINANRVTLTTGTPIMNSGDLIGYRVTGGEINFLGTGLDTSQSNYTDIIARAVNVNAGVFANNLNVVTGTNQVNVASTGDISGIVPISGFGATPTVALDVAALGGMYAGKIHLIGTEAGLGVRNAGTIGASVGEVTIDVNGRLTNSGTIASTTQTTLKATDITNTGGTVSAGQLLTVDTNSLSGDGKLLSGGDAVVTLVDDYVHTGELQADGDLTFTTAGNITNQAQILAGSNLILSAANINNQNTIYANDDLTLNATNIDNAATASISGLNTYINATGTVTNRGLIDGGETFISADTLNNIGTGSIFGDHLAVQVATLSNTSETINSLASAAVIAARNRLDIGAQTISNQDDSLIYSAGDMAIGGTLGTNHEATGNGNTLNNISASIEASGSLDINVDNINNKRRDFAITRQLSTTLPGDFELLKYNAALRFYWPYDETNPINWRNYVRDSYLNNINSLLGGTLDSTYRSELAGLINAQPFSVYQDSINIWNLLLNKIQVDHPEYIATMAQALPSHAFPLTTYNQSCRDDECAYVLYVTTQRTDYQDVVTSNASAGMISAGGNATIHSGNIINEYSTIQSGGDFSLTGTNLTNTGAELYLQSDTITSNHVIHWADRDHGTTVYGGSTSQLIGTAPAIISAGGALTGSFTGNIDNVAIREHSALVPTTSTAVPSANTVNLPTNSLFQANPSASSNYLIETNPRFANYRTWLSSDYMLSQLSYDPATTTKRLGDGFYEQKLIREQVSELTGKRFLVGYASDEAQYQALMQNGVTFAQQYQLTPGIALSAAQIAQLTSDIVWLVEKTVTLADGTTTTVLAPQVYVVPRAGDLSPSGALIAGNSIDLKLGSVLSDGGQVIANQGTFKNSGSIAGRTIVAINSDNIQNLGGLIQAGDNIDLQAKEDIVMQGSTTDIDIRQQGTANYVKQTTVNRMAGLYVSNPNATLSLDAGRDITLNATNVENAGANGVTTFKAGNNINVGVVQEIQDTYGQNKNSWSKTHSTNQVGSQINTNGDITMDAKQDINIKAGNISSDNGRLALNADDDVNITTGEATYQSEAYRKIKTSSGFGSSKKTFHDTVNSTTNISSTLSADSISINAGKTVEGAIQNANGDINIKGSNVVATNDVALKATGDISITAATDTHDETHLKKVKSSGFAASGASVSYGTRKMSSDTKTQQTTSVGSTVGSINGDVNINAGKDVKVTGSDLISGQDINVTGQNVTFDAAYDTQDTQQTTKFKQSGISLGLTGPVITAVQAASASVERSKEVKDDKLKAVYELRAALNAAKAATAVYDTINSDNPAAASGVQLSLSIGTSKSSSSSTSHDSVARGDSLTAARDINVTATGTQGNGNITMVGVDGNAGRDINLSATNDINLLSAVNDSEQHSKNKNSSAAIGVAIGASKDGGAGISVFANASAGKGKTNGNAVSHTETTLKAGDTLSLESGRDTTLKGAIVSGNTVIANIGTNPDTGGNLRLESEQDSANYKSKQSSTSGGVSYTFGAGSVGGSISSGKQKIDSNYSSVIEQTAIQAGDGGFDINVAGNTHLKGAVIDSTLAAQVAGNNQLTTQTLTTENIENKGEYKASSSTIGVSIDGNPNTGTNDPAGGSIGNSLKPGIGGIGVSDSGKAQGTTKAAIANADITITDDAAQKALTGKDSATTIATLDRDTQNANDSIENPFNQAKVQEQLEFLQVAGETILFPAAAQAAKWIGDKFPPDPEHPDRIDPAKVLAHAALGAAMSQLLGAGWQTGAAAGTLGDVLPAVLAKAFEKDENGKIKDEAAFKAASAIISAMLVSGSGADLSQAINAAMITQNAVENNYLKHQEILQLVNLQNKKLAGKCDTNCDKQIAELTARDEKRDAALEACEGQATTKCNSLRQEVRTAYAEILRNPIIYDISGVFAINDTKEQADNALGSGQGLGYASGAAHVLKESFLGIVEFVFIDSFNLLFPDQEQGKKSAAMLEKLTDSQFWEAVAAMPQAYRNQLATAYENGDAIQVGQITGILTANLATFIPSGAIGSIKKIEGFEKAVDAAKLEYVETVAKQSPVDIMHTIGADYNATKKTVTGGHSLLNNDVKVIEVVSSPDANGVYEAFVEMKTPDGQWIDKARANGDLVRNTMFPKDWSASRIQAEVDSAWNNPSKKIIGDRWSAISNSGVEITGFTKPRATAFPIYKGKK